MATLVKKYIFDEIEFNSKVLNKEARICGVSLGECSIINVYVPNGNPIEDKDKYNFKLKWFDELSQIIEAYI